MTSEIPDNIKEKIILYMSENIKYFDYSFRKCIDKAKNDFFSKDEEKKCVSKEAEKFVCFMKQAELFRLSCTKVGWDACDEIDLHDIFGECHKQNEQDTQEDTLVQFDNYGYSHNTTAAYMFNNPNMFMEWYQTYNITTSY